MSTATQTPEEVKAITTALAAPFEPTEVKFKPQSVKGNRALALAYIDCRLVQDRLDEVLGVENWMDDYEILPEGSVICRLRLNIGGNWITKTDVGSLSEQPDGGDRMKAAFSDALKRTAVKFGIGRYLYRLTAVWTDYDPQKKQFTQMPKLPDFALPPRKPAKKPALAQTAPVVSATEVAAPAPVAASNGLPKTGVELHERLRKLDQTMANRHKCQPGTILTFAAELGQTKGYGNDIDAWDGPAVVDAYEAVRKFVNKLPEPQHVQAA